MLPIPTLGKHRGHRRCRWPHGSGGVASPYPERMEREGGAGTPPRGGYFFLFLAGSGHYPGRCLGSR
eukprot:5828672-Pyramimonas_sp.AAC.1